MKQYSKKQITEAIAYWKGQLKQMNEAIDSQWAGPDGLGDMTDDEIRQAYPDDFDDNDIPESPIEDEVRCMIMGKPKNSGDSFAWLTLKKLDKTFDNLKDAVKYIEDICSVPGRLRIGWLSGYVNGNAIETCIYRHGKWLIGSNPKKEIASPLKLS